MRLWSGVEGARYDARLFESNAAETETMPTTSRRAARLLALAGALLLTLSTEGCRRRENFLWVQNAPKAMLGFEGSYQIAPGDVIGIRVWNQEANSVERARVREDGKVSMPLLNDVAVAGLEPPELARRLEAKLKSFVVNPVITVVVHERRPLRVSILGKVNRPGVYEVDRGSGVLHAIAAAGGLTAFADEDRIFVLRTGAWTEGPSTPTRIRFRYAELEGGAAPASVFPLRVGDIVVVE